jgi:putative ABC transport system substrate-binding protein
MRRREFISLVSSAALAWPLGAGAQEPGRVYRLAVAVTAGRDEPATLAFLDELRIQDFVEGKNLEIIPDGFRIRNDQAATVVPAIVKAAPDAIVSAGDYTEVPGGDEVYTSCCHDGGYGRCRFCGLVGQARQYYGD